MREVMLAVGLLMAITQPTHAGERLSGRGWTLDMTVPGGDGPFPAVILLPGCSGNTPPAVAAGLRDHARRLNASGFAAGILDVLGRGSICARSSELLRREVAAARMAKVAARRMAKDARIDGARIGFIGQSFGGSVALRIASTQSPFRAVAAYYPWCRDRLGALRVPVLIMTGTADTWTPVSRCTGLGAEVATYHGALHSFDLKTLRPRAVKGVGGTYPVAGDAASAAASQNRFIAFFRRSLR